MLGRRLLQLSPQLLQQLLCDAAPAAPPRVEALRRVRSHARPAADRICDDYGRDADGCALVRAALQVQPLLLVEVAPLPTSVPLIRLSIVRHVVR